MDQTGEAAGHHGEADARSLAQMLDVGLAHGVGMVGERIGHGEALPANLGRA